MEKTQKSPQFKEIDFLESLFSNPAETVKKNESPIFSPEKEKKETSLAEILTNTSKTEKKKAKKTMTNIYDRAKEFTSKKQQKCEALFNQLYPFKPTLNHLSLKMVKTAKNEGVDIRNQKRYKNTTPQPGPEDKRPAKIPLKIFNEKYQAMINRTKPVRQEVYIDKLDRLDENCTFKPVINSASFNSGSAGLDIYSRTVRDQTFKNEKIEKLQIMKEIEELNQCTFTPRINRHFEKSFRPSETFSRSHVRGYSRGSKSARSNFNTSLYQDNFEDFND